MGFIVHAFTRTHRSETQLCLTGRLEGGDTFAVVLTHERPRLYVRERDAESVSRHLASSRAADSIEVAESDFRTMDGEPCRIVTARTQRELSKLATALDAHSVRTYEADIRLPDAYLMNHSVRGSIRIDGGWRTGRHVDRIYLDPEISPSTWIPQLSVASIDIETNPFGEEIYAAAIQFRSSSGTTTERVFLRSQPSTTERAGGWKEDLESLSRNEGWTLDVLPTERELLRAWNEAVIELDPDLITGWNVTSFDFARIVSRLEHFGIPFRIGRSGEVGSFFAAVPGKPSTVVVPGRQVLDALRIARSGPRRFPDHSLETVASEVLGRGKTIETRSTRAKLERIKKLYATDPFALCSYCLEDARLVNEILDKTGLLELTVKRSLLIGVPLSRAWTSIAAFDFVYIEAMHRRRIVAPTLGVDALPMLNAPGGAIISPFSGIFDNVLVFDFKSLYPSIIRTFNIDPLAYGGSEASGSAGAPPKEGVVENAIEAPNGARFRREDAILPALLDGFFSAREEAKHRNDATAAYVYKILSNSFYGVLGASGCRFAGSDLAGAITGFGKRILYWCRDLLEREGFHTLYGDTDSLFVESHLPRSAGGKELRELGGRLCSMVNERLAVHVREHYGLESKLELEFEKVYVRFFVPPLRAPAATRASGEGAKRGRAKGYAGYLRAGVGGDRAGIVEVKGMEAVRRDWTQAAKDLQLALLRMLFEDTPLGEFSAFLRRYIGDMREGKLDDKLVYTKALRKSVAHYTNSVPPHVQAARQLDKLDQQGVVSYLWTTAGPQPVGAVSAPIDYDHYLEKQLKPIVGTFAEALHSDLDHLFDSDGQLNLF